MDLKISGVTRVGVTRGRQLMAVTLFWGRKYDDIFLVIASETDDLFSFFSCHLLTTPIFPRRLSSILSKFSHKKLILGRGQPLEGVTRGGPPGPRPPSDATDFKIHRLGL